MTIRTIKKNKQKELKIKALTEELTKLDKFLELYKTDYKMVVQNRLNEKGYASTTRYDNLLELLKLDLEEKQIVLSFGLKFIAPTFEYQQDKRWQEIQTTKLEKSIKSISENIADIEKSVSEIETKLAQEHIWDLSRREQILEELAKLGEDISEFKTPDYIG